MRRGIRIIIGIFSIFLMSGGGASWADAVIGRHTDKEWMLIVRASEPWLESKDIFHRERADWFFTQTCSGSVEAKK